jgi:hypothetical protein
MSQETKFYEISQNNSGGSFVVDSKLCHRIIIEASSAREATRIAEDLGCYWDGVREGMDCSCCGDRWYEPDSEVNIQEMNDKWGGMSVQEWINGKKAGEVMKDVVLQSFKSKFPGATWTTEPVINKTYGSLKVEGKIRLDSIEQYAQIMADEYGWTSPDIRIFYKSGDVKDIFSSKVEKRKG